MNVGNLISGYSTVPGSICTFEHSQFTYCWKLDWGILSIAFPAYEMSTIVQEFEHSITMPSLGSEWNWPFPVLWSLIIFPNFLAHWVQHFNSIIFVVLIWNRSHQISRSVLSDSFRCHESQRARPPCPSLTPGVHSDSRPSSQWCHPDTSSSVAPFSSCPQSLPASESFPMSQLF